MVLTCGKSIELVHDTSGHSFFSVWQPMFFRIVVLVRTGDVAFYAAGPRFWIVIPEVIKTATNLWLQKSVKLLKRRERRKLFEIYSLLPWGKWGGKCVNWPVMILVMPWKMLRYYSSGSHYRNLDIAVKENRVRVVSGTISQVLLTPGLPQERRGFAQPLALGAWPLQWVDYSKF